MRWAVSVTRSFFTCNLAVFHARVGWSRESVRMCVTCSAVLVVQAVLALGISPVTRMSLFWSSLLVVAAIIVMSYAGHTRLTFRQPTVMFERVETQ